jgi:streptogramin lyase
VSPDFAASAIAAFGPQIWIVAGPDVVAVDFPSKAVHKVSVGGVEIDAIAAGKNAIWAADFGGSQLIKIDPSTYQVVDRIAVPSAEGALELNGTVWVPDHEEGLVTLVDATTDKVLKTVTIDKVGAGGPQNVDYGLGSVWITEPDSKVVVRMDPATDAIVAKISMPNFAPCGDVATTSEAAWVPGCFNTMYKIDSTTNKALPSVTLSSQGATPINIDDSVWMAITDAFVHFDPQTGQVDKQVSIPQVTAGGPSVLVGQTLYVSDGVASVHAVPVSLFASAPQQSP